MNQATIDVLLGAVVGTITFCCWWLLRRAGSLAARHARFLRFNDKLLCLLHDLVRLHNEVVLCEQSIAQLAADAPAVEHQHFARRMVELAGAIPPLVLAQIRRFRLVEPPPVEAPEPGPPEEHVAAIEDAWGGET